MDYITTETVVRLVPKFTAKEPEHGSNSLTLGSVKFAPTNWLIISG